MSRVYDSSPNSSPNPKFFCHKKKGKKAKLQLEVVYPSESRNILQRCTIIETGTYEQNANGALAPTIMLDFAPLRPIRALVQV
jgi:hypothetical protein